MTPATGRLAHFPAAFDELESSANLESNGKLEANGNLESNGKLEFSEVAGAHLPTKRPVLALTAEGPRRADLIAWASAHRGVLDAVRLLAPAGIKALLHEHVGLTAETLKSGTIGPTATAGLAAAGEIDAMIAFSDPIELRPGDNTTRSLTRLAVFWDIPIASNRATADLLLTTLTTLIATSRAAAIQAGTRAAGMSAAGMSAAGMSAARKATSGTATAVGPNESEPIRDAVKLWTVRATVEDVPGRLAVLAASLARRAINILSVQVHLTQDGPVDELLVAASPVLSAGDLTAAIVDGGARSPRVTPADAHALVDAPTRALALAARLVRTPDELGQVLLSLLPGAKLTWRAEPPEAHEDTSGQLWLDEPSGGGFLLSRPTTAVDAAEFTPAESARAYAMVDIFAALASGGLTTPEGRRSAREKGRSAGSLATKSTDFPTASA